MTCDFSSPPQLSQKTIAMSRKKKLRKARGPESGKSCGGFCWGCASNRKDGSKPDLQGDILFLYIQYNSRVFPNF